MTLDSLVYFTVEEEQSREDEDEESEEETDEGVDVQDDVDNDPIDSINGVHAVLTSTEQVTEEVSPALQDVLMTASKLHLPGYEEVENLALVLLELTDSGDRHIVPADVRQKITTAVSKLHDHGRTSNSFESRSRMS